MISFSLLSVELEVWLSIPSFPTVEIAFTAEQGHSGFCPVLPIPPPLYPVSHGLRYNTDAVKTLTALQ